MSTLGSYQDDIETLNDLELSDYERIFKVFSTNINGRDIYFYNILKKLELPDSVDSEYIGFYTPKGDMPWSIVSYNIYENLKMWWLVYLMNRDEVSNNRFVAKGGVQLKYLLPEALGLIYNQITNITINNGQHY